MIAAGCFLLFVGFLILSTTTTDASASEVPFERRVWCYYSNWAQYRPGNMKYVVDDIDPSLCTHFSFAFAVIKDNLVIPFEKNDDDITFQEGMYTKFNRLRLNNPHLKTFLAVGGWKFGSILFSEMAQSPASRRTFINSAVNFLRERHFDGLDLDWEYPANRNGSIWDKQNFSLLIKELYEAFIEDARRRNNVRLMLTIAVGAGKQVIDSAYDVPEISRFVDFINIMSYDYHGSWENTTAHSSPLFAGRNEKDNERYFNTAWSAIYWVKKGAPQRKINVGIPLYGRSFTLLDATDTGVGAYALLPGHKGPFTRDDGFLAYFESCQILRNGAKRFYLEEQKVSYLVQNDQWISYEDKRSIISKVEWVIRNHFNGVMVWTIDLDDYKGKCGGVKYPLMKAINRVLHQENPPTRPDVVQTTVSVNTETSSNLNNNFCKYFPFGVYRSPVSCFHFVLCMSGYTYLNQCKQNMEWNSSARRCVLSGNGDCRKMPMWK